MQRAKMSSEKALVKEVVTVSCSSFSFSLFDLIRIIGGCYFMRQQNFAVEISAEDRSDLDINEITKTVIKAGGANYGSGKN